MPTDAALVKKIGKYEVTRVLGRGGMGVVYLAEDKRIGRKVAIKTLTEGYSGQPEMLERFYREAKAGILQHPNIVTVFDLGDQDGMPFIVMDYVPGDALDKIIASGRQLTMIDKLSIIEQVCSALDYAHRNGVVHRDIKPANIIVEPSGHPKLVDFGIAHMQSDRDVTSLTRTGNVIGTIYYIAPERLTGSPFDGRSDIFATGVLLYQLLAGQLPFAGEDMAVLHKIVNDPHPPLETYISNYPPELDSILDRSLAKDPEDRYATAEDFALDLHSIIESLKKGRVTGLFDDAERLASEKQYSRAKEVLLEVVKIESTHTGARQLLRIVQKEIDLQGRAERVREHVEQAEEHLFSERFQEAIASLEQAIKLDSQNIDLKSRLETARNKKYSAEQVARHLAEAETLREKRDYTGALNILEKATLLDPKNSRVQATYAAVQKQAQVAAQAGKVRELLENARRELAARHFTAAIQILIEAGAINPSAPDLDVLRDKAEKGKAQEDRRRVLEEIQRRVNEHLVAEQYDQASDLLNRAIERLPNEPLLHRLKADVETEVGKLDTRRFVGSAIARARELFATSPLEALASLQQALERVPGDEGLLSYERSLREQFNSLRVDQLRDDTLGKAREFIAVQRLDKAIGVLESFQLEIGNQTDIDDLLALTRDRLATQQRRARIDQCTSEARSLEREERLDDAVRVLESGIRETGDASLSSLLEEIHQKQAASSRKLEILQKRVSLARERGELGEAIQLLQDHLATAPGSTRIQAELSALMAEKERKEVIAQAIVSARQALERRDFAGGWESLQTVLRAYGESPELTAATEQFQARRASIAQEEVGKAIETARAALLKNEPEAALTALKASMAMVEFADAAMQSEWRAMGQRAKAPRRPTGTMATSTLLDEPFSEETTPKRGKTIIWVIAGAVLTVVVGALVFFLRPHEQQTQTHSQPQAPAPIPKTQIRIVAKLPTGEVLPDAHVFVGGSDRGTTDQKGELLISVEPGSLNLLVTKDGYDPYRDPAVEISAGETAKEPVTLSKTAVNPGSLVAKGDPAEFNIWVDGDDRGKFGNGKPLNLAAGKYRIQYKARGYEDSPEHKVKIEANVPHPDSFRLKKLDQQPPITTAAKVEQQTQAPQPQSAAPAPAQPQALPSGSLSASANKIEHGQSVDLTWHVSNASSLVLIPFGVLSPQDGHRTDIPDHTTKYQLIVNGAQLDEKTVEVSEAKPPTPQPTPTPVASAANTSAKPAVPDRAALEPALLYMQSIFGQASGKKGSDCKAALSKLPASKKVLEGLQGWCGDAPTFAGHATCSGSPTGDDREAAWICTETVSISGQSPVDYTKSTFTFAKTADGGWRVTKWDY